MKRKRANESRLSVPDHGTSPSEVFAAIREYGVLDQGETKSSVGHAMAGAVQVALGSVQPTPEFFPSPATIYEHARLIERHPPVMAQGAGKYDEVATLVRKTTKAAFVGVLILNGDKGSGFSMQSEESTSDPKMMAAIPAMLRKVADEIEADLKVPR